ncbi:hypothetical protein SNE40_005788 [Patella caerulea]
MQLLPTLYCAVLLLVVYIESGLALKCYECNSFTDQACKSIGEDTIVPLITCPTNSTGCRKVEQRLTYDGDEHIRFYRQCASSVEPKRCIERSGTLGVKMFYCNCDGDGCNSGSTVTLSLALFATSFAFIQLFKNL